MIVRILGEGQWEVPDSAIADLNALDDQVEQAVAQQDQAGLAQALGELLSEVRTIGTAVPDEEIARRRALAARGPPAGVRAGRHVGRGARRGRAGRGRRRRVRRGTRR